MQVNKCGPGEKQALVALGANLPIGRATPQENVTAAMDMLEKRCGTSLRRSRLWRTPAYPEGAGPPFVNAALSLDWQGTARELLALLHGVEEAFGRQRTSRWEARRMDLDLIGLGDLVLPDPDGFRTWHDLPPEEAATRMPDELILPHPRMHERVFVLAPLCEVAPDWRHPVLGRTVREMLDALPASDHAGVAPLGPRGEGMDATP
ncbi:MAG: 2-amino-4-hydroxy-6-hydroxymethyldihydropteridine diphosphokinase FolK [Rhodobacteraceae bacterium HLUCCO18]|nr:MAG: 2-amino-4-hydroxy-6-hydroxymethyldihydropteridine diphosphokinase FolK [Rhodobacteraceae bacterium HLUCCO18]